MNYNKNMRGFTLIELLAVIVVLAIVMLIAVRAVLPQMEKARKQSLIVEANGAIQSAQQYFMSADLTGAGSGLPTSTGATSCVPIATLSKGYSELDDDYEGKVIVTKVGDYDYSYKVWLHKKSVNLMIVNGDYKEMTEDDVEGDGTWSSANSTC